MIDADYLRKRVAYDPETGVFTWKPKSTKKGLWNNRYAGKETGMLKADGYVYVQIDNKRFLGHRLAWLYVYGEWPAFDLDHQDRNRSNNSIANLRPANRTLNGANRSIAKNNTSGLTGVARLKSGSWVATLSHQYLGAFPSKEEAAAARRAAAIARYGEYAAEAA